MRGWRLLSASTITDYLATDDASGVAHGVELVKQHRVVLVLAAITAWQARSRSLTEPDEP